MWLVTGAAGFIGSNLVEHLLKAGHRVRGLDNFATGHQRNLEDVKAQVGPEAWARFDFIEGDIRDLATCHRACASVEYVLHQAALGSVPRSIKDPLTSHAVNVDGSLNMLVAARDAKVKRFVYASSSSVYGDHPALPKVEGVEGTPLSPYAVTKKTNEVYARVFFDTYQTPTVGLRYFNVFGRRQDPNGQYAAVIPKWTALLLKGEPCVLYGDGETSRDFCYVDNVVQANVLAALAPETACGQVFNIAYGGRTTLKELYALIRANLKVTAEPRYEAFRPGDIRHSNADISRARSVLGYAPKFSAEEGLKATMAWYVANAHFA